MNLNWFEGILYGLVSGIAEFLPISSHAHQSILLQLFGSGEHDVVRDLLVHIALLLSLISGCRSILEQIRREQNQRLHNRRTHRGNQGQLEMRFLKNAAIPMVIGLIILSYISQSGANLLTTSVFLLINGILLFIPERMIQGNKDARSMSVMDSILAGTAGALSALGGISRIGSTTSAMIARGTDRRKALNWALLLSIPAIVTLIGLDFIQLFANAGSVNIWPNFFGYILSAIGAYLGGYLGILLIKFLFVRSGFSGFAYYSWGAALFSFLLYLTVV